MQRDRFHTLPRKSLKTKTKNDCYNIQKIYRSSAFGLAVRVVCKTKICCPTKLLLKQIREPVRDLLQFANLPVNGYTYQVNLKYLSDEVIRKNQKLPA